MRKLKFLLLTLLPFISACNFNQANENGENINPEPQPPQYEQWDKKVVDDLVKVLGIDTEYSVPAYDKCIEIEYDGDNALLEGYFGVYCKTEFEECETLYTEILQDNNWVIKDKMGGFSVGFSPDYQLMVEYIYEAKTKELVIYVTEGAQVDWPSESISDCIQALYKNATTTIPKFEAEYYQVNYYDWIGAIAINGYGVSSTITQQYKLNLEENEWLTYSKSDSQTFGAISPNKELRIDFYYDDSKLEFNIDIFKYLKPVQNWPENEINNVLQEMGVTGNVIPFQGECTGFSVDLEWTPPAIFVYMPESKKDTSVSSYNQLLIDSGYVLYGYIYSDPLYCFPGTTLGYRAADIGEECMTIELFDIANPYIEVVE